MAPNPGEFPSNVLLPCGGEIYCHIFENRNTGLPRNLFWSVTVDFEPLQYGDDEFSCSMTCEWIAWPLRHWKDLDKQQLDVKNGENGIESSFYMTRHDLGTNTKLSLRHRRDNVFTVDFDMLVDFQGYYGGDENPAMAVHAKVDVPFIGLLVIPGNLFPKPSTPTELQNVALEFVELSAYEEPQPWKTHGFIFRPAGTGEWTA